MQQLSYSGVNSASMCRRCVPPTARTAPEARIVSVCASYAQFSLLAMKRDGRKGSANPSRSMESRRLTPPRLDRNRNAHPSCRDRRCVLVRKNAVSASQKQRGPSCGATRRKRPLCLVLRRAILLPRAAELSLPVCRLPSQAHAQWLTFVTQLSLFRCILALTVPFAVVLTHFLLGCRLTRPGLCSGQPHDFTGPYSLNSGSIPPESATCQRHSTKTQRPARRQPAHCRLYTPTPAASAAGVYPCQ